MSKTILVVDDLLVMRNMLKKLLQQENYNVIEASNGKIALTILEANMNNLPDLILLDIKMPVMDGVELLKNLNNRFNNKIPIPIIILSAQETTEDVMNTIQLGASDYIVKPFKNIELIEKIKKNINL